MYYYLDDLVIDIDRESVWRGKEMLPVAGLSFRLLAFLLAQGDRVVSFDELIEGVWSPSVVNEDTVTQRVRLLRNALGDDASSPRYIVSVRGRGYQLGFSVAERPAAMPLTGSRWRKAAPTALLMLVIFGGLLAWQIMWKPSAPLNTTPDPQLERAEYYAGIGQRDDNERAITLYEKLLSEHPDNRRAQLGLSFAYSARVCRYNFPDEWAERALDIARRVMAKVPRNADAWSAQAYAQDCLGRIDAAIAAYRRAVELDVTDSASRSSLAYLLGEKGRLADALALNLAIRDSDPGQTFTDLQLARNYELLGYLTVAETLYAQSFELYPDNIFSNVAYPSSLYRQGRFSDARRLLAVAEQRPSHPELFVLAGELQLLAGEREKAHQAFEAAAKMRRSQGFLQSLAQLYGNDANSPVWIEERLRVLATQRRSGRDTADSWIEAALLEQARGDVSQALAALSAAIDAGFRDRAWLQVTPLLAGLREQAGFAALVDRISTAIKTERERMPPEQRPAIPRN